MKFCLYIEQAGEGCDYMIGCGSKLVMFEATDKEDAIQKVMNLDPDSCKPENLGYYGFSGGDWDRELKRALVFAMNDAIDVTGLHADVLESISLEKKNLLDKSSEASERAEYERLRAKFGG